MSVLPGAMPSLAMADEASDPASLQRYAQGMAQLVDVVQQLSLARDLGTVIQIVRLAARDLTGADGATFVLRDGDCCYYAEENAIAPLWKGQRFPMESCISGWVMQHAQPTAIPDISLDSRIPQEAYRPTFVKSLLMVPIRCTNPIGAIGNYWAQEREPTDGEIRLLQALANTTAVAIENVQLYGDLERRVRERTAQLEAVNRELETFSYSVSHDLRAPLRSILGFSEALMESAPDKLDEEERGYLDRIRNSGHRMEELIQALLELALLNRKELRREPVDLSGMAAEVIAGLRAQDPGRQVETQVQARLVAQGDGHFLKIALENLLGNAWKYTSKKETASIQFGMQEIDGVPAFYVRDDGAGFSMQHADKLFGVFQRLHSASEYAGTGIGLATVARVINRHRGRIWADSEENQGATFYFMLPVD